MTWLLVSTRPFELMIIPVPATSPPGDAVPAVMSTIAESILATVAAEMVPPVEGTVPPVLGVVLVPVEPPGSDPFEVLEIDAVVSAQAVPPPAPTQAIAKAASAVRRNPAPRGRWGVGGQLGGPQWGSADQ
jgi:hypothetical protein